MLRSKLRAMLMAKQEDILAEFQQLEFIESTGTQWINTGVCPNTNTIIEIDLKFSGTFNPKNGNTSIIGCRDANDRISCNFGGQVSQSREIYFWIGNSSSPVYRLNDLPIESRNTLTITSGSAAYEKQTINISIMKTGISVPFTLFGRNTSGTVAPFNAYNMIVYCCKIYDGEKLVRDFIPVKRKSNEDIGLYDKVTKQFFANQGTGEFNYAV